MEKLVDVIKLYRDEKIPSTNKLYIPRSKGRSVWLQMDPEVKNFKENLTEKVKKSRFANEFSTVFHAIEKPHITFKCALATNFIMRDCTNLIKAMEDAFRDGVDKDDRYTVRCTVEKVKSPNKFEYIIIEAEEAQDYQEELTEEFLESI